MSGDEFEIIRRYFTRPCSDADLVIGIGDDAAVVATHGPLAIAVDTLVAGVHFPVATPAEAVGHRLLAVNLSDLAAMGARPRWCTLALTLPAADEVWLAAFSHGLFALADAHGVALIGGDLTRGPLTATLQIMGDVEADAILTRAGARVGDDIYVTGTLGDSAAGLALLQADPADPSPAQRALRERFLKPSPRVAQGRALRRLAHAAIDVSDGLLADLGHVCAASGCAAQIDVEQLPLSGALRAACSPADAETYALAGGDDYELCFTAPPAVAPTIEAALEGVGPGARRIGRMVQGRGVTCLRNGVPFEPAARGYRHFIA